MRRCLLVMVGVVALLGEACTVGRDLAYTDPALAALAEGPGTPATDEAGAGTTASPSAPVDGGVVQDSGGEAQDGAVAGRPVGCPANDSYEVEPNDTPAAGNVLATGDTCGYISTAADVDSYSFVVKHVNIGMQFQADADARMNYVDTDDPSDTGDMLGNGGSFTLYGATPGHRYTVRVSSAKHQLQGYLVTLTN